MPAACARSKPTTHPLLSCASRVDPFDVERLARVVLDSREHDQGDRVACARQDLRDLCRRDPAVPPTSAAGVGRRRKPGRIRDGLHGLDGVVVRGKSMVFDQNPVPLARRAIEGRHHQMEIDRERIHGHDLRRHRPHEARRGRGQQLVVGHPRIRPGEMRLDAEASPLFELFFQVPAGPPRQESQGIAGEIELPLAAFPRGNVKLAWKPRSGSVRRARPRNRVRLERLAHERPNRAPEGRATRAPSRAGGAPGSFRNHRIRSPSDDSRPGKGVVAPEGDAFRPHQFHQIPQHRGIVHE